MTVELVKQGKGKKVGSDQWFTTAETEDWALSKLPGVPYYDLDPAACHESYLADAYYTLERGENGLVLPWWGNVWVNPPFSKIRPWVERAWYATTDESELNRRAQTVSLLAPAVKMEQPWWQDLIEPFRDGRRQQPPYITTHFTRKRVSFAFPGSGGIPKKGASFGCVLITFERLPF